MKRSFMFILAAFAAVTCCHTSQAAPTYKWATDASTYSISSGGSQVVKLYLSESGASGTSGIAAEGGLLSVGFKVTATTPGSIVSFTPNTIDFSVDDGSPTTTSTAAAFYAEISNARFIADNGPKPDVNGLINLGTITVNSTGPGIATFNVVDFDAGNAVPKGQTGTIDGVSSLDNQISSASFTVTVPEPASMGVIGAASLLLLKRRRG